MRHSSAVKQMDWGKPMTALLAVSMSMILALTAPDPSVQRKAFSSCLYDFVQTSAQKKTTPEQFDTQIGTACATEEQSFRRSVVASDVSRGISRKTSEQGVADEI